MDIASEQQPRKIRKNRYIPNFAAAKFRPTNDWTAQEALTEFRKATFPKIEKGLYRTDDVFYEDCIKGMKKLPSKSIDVIIADPPFGLNFTGKESIYNRDARFVKSGYQEVDTNYEQFSRDWIGELPRIMKETGSAWIVSGWTNLGDVLTAAKESGLTLINHIIWKYQFGVFTRRKFVTSHYHILFLAKSEKYYFNKVMHYPLDVWEINRTYRRGEAKNGTKLPENLILRCIDFSSKPGQLILDPFMGNGTTATAAKGTFRHYLGFEANKAMKDVIHANLKSTKVGQFYSPYAHRDDELVKRAKFKYGTSIQERSSMARLDQF